MSINLKRTLKHCFICGFSLLLLTTVGATSYNTMSHNANANADTITEPEFRQTANQRRQYFKEILSTFSKGDHTYKNPFKHSLKFLKQPKQLRKAPQMIRVDKPNKYGQSISFYPSGIRINQNGHVYVKGRFIGFLNISPQINNTVNTFIFQWNGINGQQMFPTQSGMSYAIRLGSIKGHTVTVLVPRVRQTLYNNRVSSNDAYHLSKVYRWHNQKTNADIIRYGHNDNAYGAKIQHWIKYYVNQARQKYGLKPYRYNPRLQIIANMRATQIAKAYQTQPKRFWEEQQQGNDVDSDNWIHGKDLKQSNINDAGFLDMVPFSNHNQSNSIAENAGNSYMGSSMTVDMGYKAPSIAKTPRQLAYNIVQGLMEHDNASHNGHRQNILAPKMTYAGFGVHLYRTSSNQLACSYVFDMN